MLTGGAGYIGSHTAVELLAAGWDVVVVDDFSNSSPVALDRVGEIAAGRRAPGRCAGTGSTSATPPRSPRCSPTGVDAVVHFAGLKAVGESVAEPLRYYTVNVAGTASLLRAMDGTGVRRLVFSSSCTVYGDPERVPVDETASRQRHQPLRAHQAHRRGHARRHGRERRPLAAPVAALLQPGRRPRQRPHRRGPRGHPQQPDAVHHAGRHRAPPVRAGVRRRLPDARRHRRARLHPRGRPRARPPRRARRARRADRVHRRQPRHGHGVVGARGHRGRLAGRRPRDALPASSSAARATSPPPGPTRPSPTTSSAGRRPAASTTWPPTTGAGSRRTPRATRPPTPDADAARRRPRPTRGRPAALACWPRAPRARGASGVRQGHPGARPRRPPRGPPPVDRRPAPPQVEPGTELGRRVGE